MRRVRAFVWNECFEQVHRISAAELLPLPQGGGERVILVFVTRVPAREFDARASS